MLILDASGLDWATGAQTGGTIGVLVLLVVAILTRKIVPGWTYDAMEKDRDYYRELAAHGTEIAARQMTVAEVLADRMERRDEEEREARLHARRTLLRREGEDHAPETRA
jgi:hypothetical protein